MEQKKAYRSPTLRRFGSVARLTHMMNAGSFLDMMGGEMMMPAT
jgi:hypothetical protein